MAPHQITRVWQKYSPEHNTHRSLRARDRADKWSFMAHGDINTFIGLVSRARVYLTLRGQLIQRRRSANRRASLCDVTCVGLDSGARRSARSFGCEKLSGAVVRRTAKPLTGETCGYSKWLHSSYCCAVRARLLAFPYAYCFLRCLISAPVSLCETGGQCYCMYQQDISLPLHTLPHTQS